MNEERQSKPKFLLASTNATRGSHEDMILFLFKQMINKQLLKN